MNPDSDEKPLGRSGYRTGTVMIALTALACLIALAYRTEIRSRVWAVQLIRATTINERAIPLTMLCNAREKAWWGARTLLAHENEEVRQYGVLVLQYIRTPQARARLLTLLEDESNAVRELAALGLAMHGDDAVVPALTHSFVLGAEKTAGAACLTLERLGSPAAVRALSELAAGPLESDRAAMLIDALAGIGTSSCAAGLLPLLDDHRPSAAPSRAERMLAKLRPIFHGEDLALLEAPEPHATVLPGTIAERAAAALARITGLDPQFSSQASEEERAAAIRSWEAWIANQSPP